MESDDLKQLLIDAQHVAEVNESQSEEEAANHSNAQDEEEDSEVNDFVLEQTLGRLEKFLCFLGFRQSSLLGFVISWFAFLILGVSIPIATLELLSRSDCEKYEMNRFEVDIMVPHACLAGVSLICVSHNLRKYGLRRFLFVDRYHGHMIKFRKDYIEKIKGFFRLMVIWILPCILLKTICEMIQVAFVQDELQWKSILVCIALVVSWTYLTTVSLSACILFNLVCNLQVIHFEDYGRLLESDLDISVYMEEHKRLRLHLSKISHRFRIYLLLEFLVVTASQFITLFQTTGYHGFVSFVNGGDFAVTSIIQVGGVILCLHAAVKISHRAQSIVSVASTWHALVTCNSNDASLSRVSNSTANFEAVNAVGSSSVANSETDLESLDSMVLPTNLHVTSCMSTFNKRQAFVMYLQSNPGGVTIFGWTVDRTLIDTIFCIELSLVLFVLGKTIVF